MLCPFWLWTGTFWTVAHSASGNWASDLLASDLLSWSSLCPISFGPMSDSGLSEFGLQGAFDPSDFGPCLFSPCPLLAYIILACHFSAYISLACHFSAYISLACLTSAYISLAWLFLACGSFRGLSMDRLALETILLIILMPRTSHFKSKHEQYLLLADFFFQCRVVKTIKDLISYQYHHKQLINELYIHSNCLVLVWFNQKMKYILVLSVHWQASLAGSAATTLLFEGPAFYPIIVSVNMVRLHLPTFGETS
jgi:hypothetical protein